jgi:hypothetical protein
VSQKSLVEIRSKFPVYVYGEFSDSAERGKLQEMVATTTLNDDVSSFL